MYVTISKSSGVSGLSFHPPAYIGTQLLEAVRAAIKIAAHRSATLVAVYEMKEGKDYGHGSDGDGLVFANHHDHQTGAETFVWRAAALPELYKRGLPEFDRIYDSQNPRP